MAKRAEVIEDYVYPPGLTTERELLVDQILWALHLFGPYEDEESGRAMAPFRKQLIDLGGDVPETPSVLTTLLREMTTAKFGGYVRRDTNSTRTTYLGLASGIDPEAVAFPPCPFSAEVLTAAGVLSEDADDIGDLTAPARVPTDDAAGEGPSEALRAAMDIVRRATELARLIAAQPASGPIETMDWVKQLVDENAELRAEVGRLGRENETYQGLIDTLTPIQIEAPAPG